MSSVARALLRNNVRAVFGIPGTHTVPIYRGLQALDGRISTVTTRHEAGAGYAADGCYPPLGPAGPAHTGPAARTTRSKAEARRQKRFLFFSPLFFTGFSCEERRRETDLSNSVSNHQPDAHYK